MAARDYLAVSLDCDVDAEVGLRAQRGLRLSSAAEPGSTGVGG
jgi:hypothetical protein